VLVDNLQEREQIEIVGDRLVLERPDRSCRGSRSASSRSPRGGRIHRARVA